MLEIEAVRNQQAVMYYSVRVSLINIIHHACRGYPEF